MGAMESSMERKIRVRHHGVTRGGTAVVPHRVTESELRRLAADAVGLEAADLEGLAVDETDDAIIYRPFAIWG